MDYLPTYGLPTYLPYPPNYVGHGQWKTYMELHRVYLGAYLRAIKGHT
jgi:hypothetical protein